MARPLTMTITESREELEQRLHHEPQACQQERSQTMMTLMRRSLDPRVRAADPAN